VKLFSFALELVASNGPQPESLNERGAASFQLLAARVHHGDHIQVFVSARPKLCIPEMMCVLKCNSARLLFEEFPEIKLRLWGRHLWSEGYAVRTAGVVNSAKIKEYINKN
jgi:putative transposase